MGEKRTKLKVNGRVVKEMSDAGSKYKVLDQVQPRGWGVRMGGVLDHQRGKNKTVTGPKNENLSEKKKRPWSTPRK